jgi:hypothetical protein
VDDAAAETFATSFYRHLLIGDKFGDAVRAAREETFDRHGTSNTWGAYQCYGDPAFRLRPRTQQQKSDDRRNYHSPAQAVMDLENLANQVRMGSGSPEEVEAVVQAVTKKDESWLGRPDVAAALGIACGEIGLFERAIINLDKAIGGEAAEYPMRIVEQRANFKSRLAVERKRSGTVKAGMSSPDQLIQDAIDDLGSLLKFNKSAERLSLLGSAHKRMAWISTGDDRKKALSKMAGYYREAHEKKYDEKRNKLDTYPLLNWLAAEILREWYGVKQGVTPAVIREWCERARAYADEQDRQEPNFWNSVVKPECELVQALASATLDGQKQAIIDAYRRARVRGASPREFRSVTEHLEFLVDLAEGAGKKGRQQAAALREIMEQLVPLAEGIT